MKKFNVSHNTYKNFKEIEKLPEIGDNYDGRKVIAINEIGMDCEQPFDDNFNYDLYEIVCEDEDVDTVEWYVCVKKEGMEQKKRKETVNRSVTKIQIADISDMILFEFLVYSIHKIIMVNHAMQMYKATRKCMADCK